MYDIFKFNAFFSEIVVCGIVLFSTVGFFSYIVVVQYLYRNYEYYIFGDEHPQAPAVFMCTEGYQGLDPYPIF